MLFHEFALNPESSTFGQSGGARVKESASHHEIKPHNTNNTLKVESALLSALLASTGVNFNVNFHVLCFLCFLQAGSLPKSLFLSVGTFVDLPKLIPNTFGIFHENMFFEVSGVILTSFWKVF